MEVMQWFHANRQPTQISKEKKVFTYSHKIISRATNSYFNYTYKKVKCCIAEVVVQPQRGLVKRPYSGN